MKEMHLIKSEDYRLKSSERNNVRLLDDNYSGDDIPGSLVIIKDIPKGGKMLRSYGIPTVIQCFLCISMKQYRL
jgi:hypothetical protein